MTDIYVCDDDRMTVKNTVAQLNAYHDKKENPFVTIHAFFEPLKLLESYRKKDSTLVLLDIGMHPISGIEVAQKIRLLDKKAVIVFITAYNQHFKQAFDIHAFDYLMKPINEKHMDKLLDEYYSHMHEFVFAQSPHFVYANALNTIDIETDSIYYIEHYRNVTTFVTEYKKIEIYASLKDILPKLPNHFVQCHRAIIVNVAKLEKRTKDTCYLRNGATVPIARLRQNYLRDRYVEYLHTVVQFGG